MTEENWQTICHDLSVKASKDMMDVLLRTTLLAPDSRMAAIISVEASAFVIVRTAASLAAQMDALETEVVLSLFDELKIRCLEKKKEFEELLKDPDQRADLEGRMPAYWRT
jgi:hypothetical protein